MATATAFTTISALSFQTIDTHNQPATPIACKIIFQGNRSFVVAIIANISTIEEIHLIYHTRGWCDLSGVEVFVSCTILLYHIVKLLIALLYTVYSGLSREKLALWILSAFIDYKKFSVLKAKKGAGGPYTLRVPTPHLGGLAVTQFLLPHSFPIVTVWYLRFSSTASSQRLMCGLLR